MLFLHTTDVSQNLFELGSLCPLSLKACNWKIDIGQMENRHWTNGKKFASICLLSFKHSLTEIK